MLGIVITSYNRFDYLEKCLESFSQSDFPAETIVTIIDDKSADYRVKELLTNFRLEKVALLIQLNKKRKGNQKNIVTAFDNFCELGCDLLMNLDNDAIVKREWLRVLLELQNKYPDRIVSGFDAPRHKANKYFGNYVFKKSIGGINLLLTADLYKTFLRKTLLNYHHWDWRMSQLRKSDFVVARPSMVQHIGSISTLGHRGADYSTTF